MVEFGVVGAVQGKAGQGSTGKWTCVYDEESKSLNVANYKRNGMFIMIGGDDCSRVSHLILEDIFNAVRGPKHGKTRTRCKIGDHVVSLYSNEGWNERYTNQPDPNKGSFECPGALNLYLAGKLNGITFIEKTTS